MKKIPTVLVRDPNDRAHILEEITPGCEWVFAGEGLATRKFDGTCVMRDAGGKWWARREVKPGRDAPAGFVAVVFDEVTGKTQGWEPIEQSPFHRQWEDATHVVEVGRALFGWKSGTYELVGPKINGNPDRFDRHDLIEHAQAPIMFGYHPTTPAQAISVMRDVIAWLRWEGIVWHHPDGRMAKLKVRDIRPKDTE